MICWKNRVSNPIRKIPAWLAVTVLLAAGLTGADAAADNLPAAKIDADRLIAFIQENDHRDPLVAFGPADDRVDQTLSQENRTYLSQNQALLNRVRAELASDALQWQLAQASTRLMIVPENRAAYAALFQDYCQIAVDYVLRITRLPNPYQAITTVRGLLPIEKATSSEDGITAFLVHNIADVYTEEYVFSAAAEKDSRIKIKLSSRNYTGEVGSYSSYLVIGENQQVEFVRNPYTLWRNSAEDPLNVLIVPIEETLHIALRRATEEAIKCRIASLSPATGPAVDQIVAEWLAVEEAAVGGLVRKLMPEIMNRFLTKWPRENLDATFHARRAFDKYRYLDQGIRIVEEMGMAAFIDLYRQDPQAFRAMLAQPSGADAHTDARISGDSSEVEPAV